MFFLRSISGNTGQVIFTYMSLRDEKIRVCKSNRRRMDYKVVQMLLVVVLLFGVHALGQSEIPSDGPPAIPSVALLIPPMASLIPPSSPPPPGPPTQFVPVSPSPPPPVVTIPAAPPSSGVDSPETSLPSPPSNHTGLNTWTVDPNNRIRSILVSANQKFAFNLMITNQSYCVALVQHVPSNVTVWVANFVKSQIVKSCSLNFTSNTLALTTSTEVFWSANQGDLIPPLELDDRGCLTIKRAEGSPWASFDNPSDIIITGQTLPVGKRMYAAQMQNEYQQGTGYMGVDAGQVTLFNGASLTESICNVNGELISTNISYVGVQNGLRVVAGDRTICSRANSSYQRLSLWEYARVTSTGQLVIASYVDILQSNSSTGEIYYGICSGSECQCPEGFQRAGDPVSGFACKRNATLESTGCATGNSPDTFSNVSGMVFSGFMRNNATANVSTENCQILCLKDCNCTAALHDVGPDAMYSVDLGTCYPKLGDSMQTVMQTGITNAGLQTLFLRIHNAAGTSKSSRKTVASAFAGGAGALIFLLILVSAWFLYDLRRKLFARADSGKWDSATLELFSARRPREFTYQELVESTDNFGQKLGFGGFSSVYAGHLPDNTKIAVKNLDEHELNEKEFAAAVKTLGSISHPNLVPLLGFCKDGILVYKFVQEGRSLNWYLWNSSLLINAQTCRRIALDTSRALTHLHTDCNVLHGDLKSENIVLDRSMHAHLVDFGLETLTTSEQSINKATMRNVHGYLAPEWFKAQPVTEKADVYSLGVVILELVSGRRCLKQGATPEKCFLPTWGFSLLHRHEDSILEFVNPRLDVSNLPAPDQQLLKGMVFIALWCVQENPAMRPPVKEVVRMLEGDAPVHPPLPSPALDAFARELYAGKRTPESYNKPFTHSSLPRSTDTLLR